MLHINNLSIQFSNRYLFDDVSFTVNKKDRIGLIGRNGTGKTTLLKLIKGIEQPESGIIAFPNDYQIGYLPQEMKFSSTKSIYEESKSAMAELERVSKTIHSITDEISNRTDYESKEFLNLTQKLSELSDRFNHLGGNSMDATIETVLVGLGFERTDFLRAATEFSGGWQMRLELAKILLSQPDCILLDEPTNHLDIESIQWLENFLKNYDGSIMMVSHDRNFLNKVTNRTIEIANANVYDLNLPYNLFLIAREEQKQNQLSAFENQQKQIAQTEKFIERFRSKATLATRVQSRIKQLDKIERIELEEEDNSALKFSFPECKESGKTVCDIINLSKFYGELQVLNNINYQVGRGEKIAFVGKNGEGKTTLSKIIAGLEGYYGKMELGYNVQIGYFAQHQAELLDADDTVFGVIEKAAIGDIRTRIRSLLGAFLFSGEAQMKKVKVLSGGEKSRLALAKLLLQPINLLILDEPTNHLDMRSKDILKNALIEFKGTAIIVSHDIDFLQGLTDKTLYFKNKEIKEYLGDINYFLDKIQLDNIKELERKQAESRAQSENSSTNKKEWLDKKQNYKEQNRLKKLLTKLEEEIFEIEENVSIMEKEFENPDFFSNLEISRKKQKDYDNLKILLNLKYEEWSNITGELDETN
jgi:ATP-binding cassette subfamily F protein 3